MMLNTTNTQRKRNELFGRFFTEIPADALEASGALMGNLLETVLAKPRLQRKARLIFLLYLDALRARHSHVQQERRWRRFIATLGPFADETHSLALRKLVRENADLLK
jgi:hypothetical protein